jgi:hypothetical protein
MRKTGSSMKCPATTSWKNIFTPISMRRACASTARGRCSAPRLADGATLREADTARGRLRHGAPPRCRCRNCNRGRLPHLPRRGNNGLLHERRAYRSCATHGRALEREHGIPTSMYIGPYSGISAVGGVSNIGNDSTATADVGAQPLPNLAAEVDAGYTTGGIYAVAGSELIYWFEVVGPANVAVPVILSGSVDVIESGDGTPGVIDSEQLGAGSNFNYCNTGYNPSAGLCFFNLADSFQSDSMQAITISVSAFAVGPNPCNQFVSSCNSEIVWGSSTQSFP